MNFRFVIFILNDAEQLMVSDTSSDEKVLRSRHHVILPSVHAMPLLRKRRQLTPEELEQRRKKVCSYQNIPNMLEVVAYCKCGHLNNQDTYPWSS